MVLDFACTKAKERFVQRYYTNPESQDCDSDSERTQNTWLSISENGDDLSQQTGKTSGSEKSKLSRSRPVVRQLDRGYSNYDIVIDADKGRNTSQGRNRNRIQSPLSISSNSDYDQDVKLMTLSDIKKSFKTSVIFVKNYRETKDSFLTFQNEQHREDCDQSSAISQSDSASTATSSSSNRQIHMKHHRLNVYKQGKIDLLLSVSNEARCPEVYRLNRGTVSDISSDLKVDHIDDNMNARDVLEGV